MGLFILSALFTCSIYLSSASIDLSAGFVISLNQPFFFFRGRKVLIG